MTPDREYTFLEAVATWEFLFSAIVVFGTSLAGVVFLSSAADMTQNIFNYDAQFGALVTSWINLVNFFGRILWGAFTDVIGRKCFWILSAVMQILCLLAMAYSVREGLFGPWLFSFLTLGSLYGGGFGVLPAFLSDLFGSKISSATHGANVSVWAFACVVGSSIFSAVNAQYAVMDSSTGVKHTLPQGYTVNALWLSCVPILSLIAILLLNVRREDRIVSKAGKSCRVRCLRWVIILPSWTARRAGACLDARQQEEEYKQYGARKDSLAYAQPSQDKNDVRGAITPFYELQRISPAFAAASWGDEDVLQKTVAVVSANSKNSAAIAEEESVSILDKDSLRASSP